MSEYVKSVSNYVSVRDVDKFKEVMNSIPSDNPISFISSSERSLVKFHCNGNVYLDEDNISLTDSIKSIRDLLYEDQVLVIQSIEDDGSYYINSDAIFLNKDTIEYMNFNEIVNERERELTKVISFKQD